MSLTARNPIQSATSLALLITALCLATGCGPLESESEGDVLAPPSWYENDMVEEPRPPTDHRTTFSSGQKQVLYLNFGGQTLTYTGGWSDSSKNLTHIGSGGTISPFKGGDVQKILAQVQSFYAPFNVKVVDTRPSSGNYEMVMIGGRWTDVGYSKRVYGLAPLDCGDTYHSSVGLVFSDTILDDWGSYPMEYPYLVASVAAHEAGHMFGLLHIANTCDIMSYARNELCPWNHVFEDKLSNLQSDSMGKCGGKSKQNSYQELLTALGPNPDPPAVKILSPAKGATLDSSFKVEVQADTGVLRVVLHVRDKRVAELTAPPYSFSVSGLNPGLAKLEVIGHSSNNRQSRASIVVTIKPGTKRPWLAACLSDSECHSGLCAVNNAGGGFCTQPCDMAAPACPLGSSCQLEGNRTVCALVRGPSGGFISEPGTMLIGGCSVAADGPLPWWPLPLALGLLLWLRRRPRCTKRRG